MTSHEMEGGFNGLHSVCCLGQLAKSKMRMINLIFIAFKFINIKVHLEKPIFNLGEQRRAGLFHKVQLSSVSIPSVFPVSQALCQVKGIKMNKKYPCSLRCQGGWN